MTDPDASVHGVASSGLTSQTRRVDGHSTGDGLPAGENRASGGTDEAGPALPLACARLLEAIDEGATALAEWLAPMGLSYAEFVGQAAELRGLIDEPERMDELTKGVRRLRAVGFTDVNIAAVSDLSLEVVRSRLNWRYAQMDTAAILRYHREGSTPVEIAKATGIGRAQVYRVLEDAGVQPRRKNARVGEPAKRRAIAAYRKGLSYDDIARASGLTRDQVQNTLRAAHKRGDLPDYGGRWRRG